MSIIQWCDWMRKAYRRLALKCHPAGTLDASPIFNSITVIPNDSPGQESRQWKCHCGARVSGGVQGDARSTVSRSFEMWKYLKTACSLAFGNRAMAMRQVSENCKRLRGGWAPGRWPDIDCSRPDRCSRIPSAVLSMIPLAVWMKRMEIHGLAMSWQSNKLTNLSYIYIYILYIYIHITLYI